MPEIYSFSIAKAYAEFDGTGLTVTLHYPDNPAVVTKRLAENPDFGIEVFDELMRKGQARIATPECPIKPASGGLLYQFKDSKILFHRRDKGAPTHPMCHSAVAGYANTREHVYTAKGVLDTGLREAGEENLLFTPDEKPIMIAPKGTEKYALDTAKKLGIDMHSVGMRSVGINFMPANDKLVVKTEDSKDTIFTLDNIMLEMLWATQTSLNALRIAQLDIFSDEILPLDAECISVRDNPGRYIHINRESFVVNPQQLCSIGWGDNLPVEDGIVRVYKTEWETTPNSRIPRPKLMKNDDYGFPYFMNDIGSDKPIEASHAQVFCPDDLLCRCLDELGIRGYSADTAGWWMRLERDKEKKRAEWLKQQTNKENE